MKLLFVSLLFAGAFAYNVSFPAFNGTNPLVPEGVFYTSLEGGSFLVSSLTLGTIGLLKLDGTWNPAFLVDPSPAYAGYGVVGINVDTEYSTGYWYVIACRADLLRGTGRGAVSVWTVSGSIVTFVATVDLPDGVSFPNDLALDGSGGAWITNSKNGTLWRLQYTGVTPSVTDVIYNPALSPLGLLNETTTIGLNGIRVIPGSPSDRAIVAFSDVQLRPRLAIIDLTAVDGAPQWIDLGLPFNLYGIDGIEFNPNTGDLLTIGGGPLNMVRVITSSDNFVTQFNLSSWVNYSAPGLQLTTTTWNCDTENFWALGTSYALFTGGAVPPYYGVFLVNGSLPVFPAGFDCSTAIQLPINPLYSYGFDEACFVGSRVDIPSGCGVGQGAWFKWNTTGLTGVYQVTTRTDFTNFDNFLTIYSTCPTYCPSSFAKLFCEDDSSLTGNCGASVNNRCSGFLWNFTESPQSWVYAVVNYYSAPSSSTFAVSSIALVPDGQAVPAVDLRQPRYCDPRIPTPTPSASGTGTGTETGTGTGSGTTGGATGTTGGSTGTTGGSTNTGSSTNTAGTNTGSNTNTASSTNSGSSASGSGSGSGSGNGGDESDSGCLLSVF